MHFKLSLICMCCIIMYTLNAAEIKNKITQRPVDFSEQARHRLYPIVRKCVNEDDSKLSALLKLVREGKYTEDAEFRNFIYCAFKDTGYTLDDGAINIEKAAPLYPDPVVASEVLKMCDKSEGSKPVDRVNEFFKCFQMNSPFLIDLKGE